MNLQHLVACAATAAVAAGGGWFARGSDPAASGPSAAAPLATAAPPGPRAAATAVFDTPLIAVASDGRVTLRVEQQPLDWVLDEIDRQRRTIAGWPSRRLAAPGTTTAPMTSFADPAPDTAADGTSGAAGRQPACDPAYTPVDPVRLVRSIDSGSDGERLDALLAARRDAIVLAEPVLHAVLASSASERVRIAAFEAWFEQRAGDPVALRALLDAAAALHGPQLQRLVRQRIDELQQFDRLDGVAGAATGRR